MAAKNLKEAVEQAFCAAPQNMGVDALIDEVVFQLRDFFAHEVLRLEAKHCLGVENSSTAHDLFESVFKEIPAFKTLAHETIKNSYKK